MPAPGTPGAPLNGRQVALRLLPFASGAMMAAALVLTGVAIWQTAQIARLDQGGTPTEALVASRRLERPDPRAAFPESVVTLIVTDPATGGVITVETPHPPASLARVWEGANVPVRFTPGTPPLVTYRPTVPQERRLGTLVFLAFSLVAASVLGLITRLLPKDP